VNGGSFAVGGSIHLGVVVYHVGNSLAGGLRECG